jgi:hypothetical protein
MATDNNLLSKLDATVLTAAVLTFAVAFNVGYFYQIDINIFTLFSLSEHIVFAIKALPVAVAMLVVFVIVIWIFGSTHEKTDERVSAVKRATKLIGLLLGLLWILWLVGVALKTYFDGHFGLTFSFAVIAVGTTLYLLLETFGPATDGQEDLIHWVFWAGTAIFATFVVGYVAGKGVVDDKQIPSIISLKEPTEDSLAAGPVTKNTIVVGIIIHSSEKNLLVHQISADKSKDCVRRLKVDKTLLVKPAGQNIGQALLLPWANITQIELCPSRNS